jgi:HAD superfamily hydrolase (TIGR01549 family)
VRKRPYRPLLRPLELTLEELADVRQRLMTTQLPTLDDVVAMLAAHYPDREQPDAAAMAAAAAALEEHRASCQVIDGVPEMLATLRARGWKLGLITNLSSQYASLIESHGLLAQVDTAVFSCDVALVEPEEEIYRLALSRLRGELRQAVMVGDSLRVDVEGARVAGLRAYRVHEELGDVTSAAEMAAILR